MGHFGDIIPHQSLGLVLRNYIKHSKSKHASVNKIYYNIKLTPKN